MLYTSIKNDVFVFDARFAQFVYTARMTNKPWHEDGRREYSASFIFDLRAPVDVPALNCRAQRQ